VVIRRGDIWWTDLPEPIGSAPGYRRPAVVVQANYFNRSQLATVVIAVCTTNLNLSKIEGNVLLRAAESGMSRDSVINVTQILAVDRSLLAEYAGRVGPATMAKVDSRLKLCLELD
jgi:mRNA interferase MazF